jgi:hypothetical protein
MPQIDEVGPRLLGAFSDDQIASLVGLLETCSAGFVEEFTLLIEVFHELTPAQEQCVVGETLANDGAVLKE